MAIKSGFKTVQDIIFCAAGLSICLFHVFTTQPADLSIPLLLFGGALAGSPGVLKLDRRRNSNEDSQAA